MLKKKLATLMIAFVLVFALVITGATFALFTGTATNANNAFNAGTVEIDFERHGDDPIQGPMFYTADSHDGVLPYDVATGQAPSGDALGGWAPGDTVTRSLDVVNKGTLDVRVDGIRASVNAGGLQPGDAAYEKFVDKMTITVVNTSDNKALYSGSLRNIIKTDGWIEIKPYAVISAEASKNFAFEAHLDLSASNLIQDQSFLFDFSLHASQLRNNEIPENGTLIGKVHDSIDRTAIRNAIEGAVVQIVGGPSVTTDKNGMYAFNLPEGTYTIQVSANGFNTKTESGIQIVNGTTKTVNVSLSSKGSDDPNRVWIPAKVVDKDNVKPIQDARLELINKETGVKNVAFTGSRIAPNGGNVTIIVPPGTYDARVVKDGYTSVEIMDVEITANDHQKLVAKLSNIQMEHE